MASSTIEILPADFDDPAHRAGILAVYDAYAIDPAIGHGPLDPDVRERLVDGLRDHPTCVVLLAWSGGRPVGGAVCFRGFSTFRARPLLNIHDLAVMPSARGRGVGRALLGAIESAARELGCGHLSLEVNETNEQAFAWYERFGFSDDGPGRTRFLKKRIQ